MIISYFTLFIKYNLNILIVNHIWRLNIQRLFKYFIHFFLHILESCFFRKRVAFVTQWHASFVRRSIAKCSWSLILHFKTIKINRSAIKTRRFWERNIIFISISMWMSSIRTNNESSTMRKLIFCATQTSS